MNNKLTIRLKPNVWNLEALIKSPDSYSSLALMPEA